MLKIATHNSATGERSRTWLYRLLVPFARCQSIPIKEQYLSDVTYFDLRVRLIDGQYRLCHGLWQSNRTLGEILTTLTGLSYAKYSNKPIYVEIFYEGCLDYDERITFISDIKQYAEQYRSITFTYIGVKLPEWTTIYTINDIGYKPDFPKITGWRKLLPIPYLWELMSPSHTSLNDKTYTMIDFV